MSTLDFARGAVFAEFRHRPRATRDAEAVTRGALQVMTRRYLNDADTAEALAFGYGVPPEPALTEVRCLWWRQRRQGVLLPAERRVILVAGGGHA